MSGAELSPEFRLLAACCIWPSEQRRLDAIRAAASVPIDWARFQMLVDRHHLMSMAHDGLKAAGISMPPDVAKRLAEGAVETARSALTRASEALVLRASFDAAGVPVMFLKGSSLAMMAYGNLALKHAWDIDLLIDGKDVMQACALLAKAGYRRVLPSPELADERFHAWLEIAREAIFLNPIRSVHVEVHWRLSDNTAQMANVDVFSPAREVPISGGRCLNTLADENLFDYLCLHGAHHAWARLKWLVDVAAWVAPMGPEAIEKLYRHAQASGVGRSAAQGLLLCHELFALPLPPALVAELESSRATRWLVSIAYEAMSGRAGQVLSKPLGNFKIEASHFLLASGVRYWLQELRSKSIGWTDFQRISLPRPLYFLYPMLRLPSWLWRRIGASS